jgi:DNA-binding CsgD family transcriptional regulator
MRTALALVGIARGDAWASTPESAPGLARPILSPAPSWAPADLRMRMSESDKSVVLVSFSLGRLTALTRAELSVARWASAGHSNASIASVRRTSPHTVARQMAIILSKLRIGARLELATMAELVPWLPPRPRIQSPPGLPLDSLLLDEGAAIDPPEIGRIWCSMALGHCHALAAADTGHTGHVAIRRAWGKQVEWTALNDRQREILALVADGVAQKVIAMKLCLAPATVSSTMDSARKRLGFASHAHLLRAYCGARALS